MHRSIIHNSQKVETTQMSIQCKGTNKIQYNTMGYYSAIKRNKVLIKAAILTNLEDVMLSERS